jgi:hypothetical protein
MSFRSPDGGIVAQILNSGTADSSVNLVYKGRTLQFAAPARSISTVMW